MKFEDIRTGTSLWHPALGHVHVLAKYMLDRKVRIQQTSTDMCETVEPKDLRTTREQWDRMVAHMRCGQFSQAADIADAFSAVVDARSQTDLAHQKCEELCEALGYESGGIDAVLKFVEMLPGTALVPA